jgi:hypothetical protein
VPSGRVVLGETRRHQLVDQLRFLLRPWGAILWVIQLRGACQLGGANESVVRSDRWGHDLGLGSLPLPIASPAREWDGTI